MTLMNYRKYIKKTALFFSFVFLLSACFTLRYDMKGGLIIDAKIQTVSVQ
jgi:starvation-inducible outer membrane lipoprotein